jgi:hypothetical protein
MLEIAFFAVSCRVFMRLEMREFFPFDSWYWRRSIERIS